jgi:hypothetical protein
VSDFVEAATDIAERACAGQSGGDLTVLCVFPIAATTFKPALTALSTAWQIAQQPSMHASKPKLKPINIEKLMGHLVGISDSYYRATENELLEDYLKAISLLTINSEYKLQKQMEEVIEQSRNNDVNVKSQLYDKQDAITNLTERNSLNVDAIASL